MRTVFSRHIAAIALLMLAVGAPARAHAQLAAAPRATCVGGAIGCSQMDFFIEFVGLSGPTALDAFTLTLLDPQFLFAAPGTTEAEDALGFNFYSPAVSPDGLTLHGVFDFGALLDPAVTTTLRVRAEMASTPPALTDAEAMPFRYAVAAGGETVAAGDVNAAPPVTATPEPATLFLVGSGIAGLFGWRMRGRRTMSGSSSVAPAPIA